VDERFRLAIEELDLERWTYFPIWKSGSGGFSGFDRAQ
jgi:hypothetical protein